jgi:hypothetical protein
VVQIGSLSGPMAGSGLTGVKASGAGSTGDVLLWSGMGWTTEESGFDAQQEHQTSLFFTASRSVLRLIQPLHQ